MFPAIAPYPAISGVVISLAMSIGLGIIQALFNASVGNVYQILSEGDMMRVDHIHLAIRYRYLHFTSKEGAYFRYDILTNEFGIVNQYGGISTYFKPDNGFTYWQVGLLT